MNSSTQSPTQRNAQARRVYRVHLNAPALQPAATRPPVVPLSPSQPRAPRILPPPQPFHPTNVPAPAPGKSVLKVGVDIDVQHLTATLQWDPLNHQSARTFSGAADRVAWVRQMTSAGHVVHTVYESCGFGYGLHYELREAGAMSLVITPVMLDRCPALQRSQPLKACSSVRRGAVRSRLPVAYDIWGVSVRGCPNRSWLAVHWARARSSEAHPAGNCH